MSTTAKLPRYRHHKARNLAVVRLNGKDHYLGRYDSPESHREYNRLVGEWLARGRQIASPIEGEPSISLAELIAAYLSYADEHYRKDGDRTSEYTLVKSAVRFLRIYEDRPASDFGPLALDAVRSQMLDADLSRTTINAAVLRIRRMFRWAVSKEMIDPDVLAKLESLKGLGRGRSTARESPGVKPVDPTDVEKVLPHLPDVVADMVRVQQLTGMRPGEVCNLEADAIDRSDEEWTFRPHSHKLDHHDLPREVVLGPRAQEILAPYLLRAESGYLFSPRDSEKRRRKRQHADRVTPMNQGTRPKAGNKYQRLGKRYKVASYRRAIHRACEKAGVDRWNPNQLRHLAATQIRDEYGLEAVQSVLGHQKMNTAEFYAKRRSNLAKKVAREVG